MKMTTHVVVRIKPNDWNALMYTVYEVADEDIDKFDLINQSFELYGSYKGADINISLQLAVERGAKEITRDIIGGRVTLPTLDQLGNDSRYICCVVYNDNKVRCVIMPVHICLALYSPISDDIAVMLNYMPGYIYVRLPTFIELGNKYQHINDVELSITALHREIINTKLAGSKYKL